MQRLSSRAVLLVAIVCMLLAAVPFILDLRADPRVYRMGFRHNPPYTLVHPDGSPGGLAFDALEAAAKRSGIRLTWRATQTENWRMLKAGDADLWPAADPLDSHGFPVTRPWLRDSYVLLRKRGSSENPNRIAVSRNQRTRALMVEAFPGAQGLVVPGAAEALDAVCLGRSDGAFINARLAQGLIMARTAACSSVPLEESLVRGAELPLGILYQPESEKAALRLRQELAAMVRDGTLGPIFSNWALAANSNIETQTLLLESEARVRGLRIVALLAGVLVLMTLAAVAFLYRARRMALEAAQAKSRFLALVSHELRTPLNGCVGSIDLLAQTSLNSDQRDLVGAVQTSLRGFRQIVGDVLDYSRFGGGGIALEPVPVLLNGIIDAAIHPEVQRAQAKGLEFDCDLDEKVPPLSLDAGRLRQVVAILVNNAVRFTPAGRITVRTRVLELTPDGQLQVRLEVNDTGIGIEQDKIAKLFAPFEQADTGNARRYSGLGLGLSIARAIVEKMGGTISLSSAPGLGTSARIEFRAAIAQMAQPVEEKPPHVDGLHVLVVDDVAVNTQVAGRLLRKLGCSLAVARNGREAVEAVQSGQFDLVLMDCQMPEMDGFEATQRIRAREAAEGLARLPILAMTASVLPSDRQECLDAGMDGFLGKPVGLVELRTAIAKQCGSPVHRAQSRVS